MRRLVRGLLSIGLVTAAPAAADGFRDGPWVGAPIVEKGELQFCLMAGHMETGGMMALALTPDERLVVVLERKSWELPPELDPLVKLRFDSRRWVPVLAEPASEEALVLRIVDHEAFLVAMAKAKSVTLENSGKQRLTFPFAPPAVAIKRLASCVDGGGATASVERANPFALPMPKLFTPENLERLKRQQ